MYTTSTFRSMHGGLPSRCDTHAVQLVTEYVLFTKNFKTDKVAVRVYFETCNWEITDLGLARNTGYSYRKLSRHFCLSRRNVGY